MTLRGKIKNGEVVLDQPAPLPDGTTVEVRAVVTPVAEAGAEQPAPTLYDRYKSFIGIAQDLPARVRSLRQADSTLPGLGRNRKFHLPRVRPLSASAGVLGGRAATRFW